MSREAVCPYYKRDTAVSISCEGLAPGSNIVQYFDGKEEKQSWARCVCCTHAYARRCIIAAALEEMNDDGDH